MVAGTQLGVNDVNAAGGVLGQPVQLIPGDSGDTTTDTANTTVDRELAAGTQVIVGAASSSVSLKVIDKIASAGVVMFSPANTSDQFVCYPDKGMYFRTAPTDVLQAQAVAQLISDDGGQRVAIMALNDPYGTGLADNIEKNLDRFGCPLRSDREDHLRPERAVVQLRSRSSQELQSGCSGIGGLRGVGEDHHAHARSGHRPVGRNGDVRRRRQHG